ncbi:MAG: TauD/TfdA family dioxygenase [Deltaproteobacteria bacterium]|nr:TauD/TfdA family dioxygenase [Deltaproteobacteria bacterium]
MRTAVPFRAIEVLRNATYDPTDVAASAARILDAWRDALVVHITPTREIAEVRDTYDRLLPALGTPHFLAEDVRSGDRDVQRTGELWFEVRYDPTFPDAYRHSKNPQPLHTDGSYIPSFPNATLMCCVAAAAEGGETVFISAEELVAALADEQPDLLAKLEATTMPHARSGDCRELPVIRREGGAIYLNWNYYCVVQSCPPEVRDLRERFFAFLRDSPRVRRALTEVKLRPGEAVVWRDERCLHGRNAFSPQAVSERFLWKCAINVDVFV